jgi:GTP-binding protein HflX
MTVSLVGYTNAGKSTLLNRLTGADELAADKLFATLDTRTRRWKLDGWGPVLLSDTVGFIRDLPHRLIASFRATLEETRQADLLLHVADASSDLVDSQIAAVRGVLADLGVDEKDTLLVLNKVDAVDDRERLEALLDRYPHAIRISARSGVGIADLLRATSDCLGRNFGDVDVRTSAGNGRLLAWLSAHGEVLSRHFDDESVTVHCRIPAAMLGRIDPAEARVTPHEPPTGSPRGARSTTEVEATPPAHADSTGSR